MRLQQLKQQAFILWLAILLSVLSLAFAVFSLQGVMQWFLHLSSVQQGMLRSGLLAIQIPLFYLIWKSARRANPQLSDPN